MSTSTRSTRICSGYPTPAVRDAPGPAQWQTCHRSRSARAAASRRSPRRSRRTISHLCTSRIRRMAQRAQPMARRHLRLAGVPSPMPTSPLCAPSCGLLHGRAANATPLRRRSWRSQPRGPAQVQTAAVARAKAPPVGGKTTSQIRTPAPPPSRHCSGLGWRLASKRIRRSGQRRRMRRTSRGRWPLGLPTWTRRRHARRPCQGQRAWAT
mmetsp:Transcript_9906/g.22503  ORF Transcript_9906/g.22503 Transcript_9906/m.22503 type:complete len:210 (-) Transcript_9906:157-786(-)